MLDTQRAASDAFATFAVNGYLDRHSFKKAVLAATGLQLSSAALGQLLGGPVPGDAQLGPERLREVCEALEKAKPRDSHLREVYRAFDTRGAGFLRRDEVVGIFKEVAPTVRVTAVEEVFDELDHDHTGRVSCEAFMRMMQRRLPGE